MAKKLLTVLFLLFAVPVICMAFNYEKNRLELIKPVKSGKLLLRPTFNACGFYYGTSKVTDPVLEFRKSGSSKWQTAFTPIHFFEDKNTTTGLIMNEYRGSIVKLDENTTYDVRFKNGKQVLVQGKFTTWKSNVKVAKTIVIDPAKFKAPYVISAKGTPDGWIRYTLSKGKILRNPTTKNTIEVRNAAYVLIDDMIIEGSENSRAIINITNSKAVRVRNCDISKWGRVGVQRFDLLGQFYVFPKDGKIDYKRLYRYRVNFDGAICLNQGTSEAVVERCYIHDPYGRANSWYYSHPAGPQAVIFNKPDHSTVLRYNDFIGSDLHRFNDAVESAGNFHSNGGVNRDADIYGNYMIYCNDDNIELDGGQQNVRCFWNHFEGALCGVSIQGCMTSPVYVFENIFDGLGAEFGETNSSIKTSGQMGIRSEAFIFNNTFVGRGNGISFNDKLKMILKNNIFVGEQTVGAVKNNKNGKLSSNSIASKYAPQTAGIDKFETALENSKFGFYAPVNAQQAERIANFCENTATRGAIGKGCNALLPYRPIPVAFDRYRIEGVKIKDNAADPAEVKITATVGGRNFKSAYTIRKNDVFDWMEITPSKGVLKSGDKITFTVKFIPEKMNERRFYRGAFSLRLANGFSRVVAVYADTDFVQPFKLDKEGETAVYIEPVPAKAYRAKNNKPSTVTPRDNPLGRDGKVVIPSSRSIYEYTFEVPKDGRYFVMLHGCTTSYSSSLIAAVDNDKMEMASLQAKKYMTWMPLAPGSGYSNKNRCYDLKKGTHKLRIRAGKHPFFFDGIVVTDAPGSFEQR